MIRSAGPHRADRLTNKILSVLLLLFVVSVIPVSAPLVVQTPAGTPRVIQTPTQAPTTVATPVATVQTVTTATPQTMVTTIRMTSVATPVPTVTIATPYTAKTVSPAYTPVVAGTPVIVKTTGGTSGAVTGTPYSTGAVGGPAGTPRIIGTTAGTGGVPGTQSSISGTGPQATAGGSGAGPSFAGDSPVLAAAIAGTFNESKLHMASLQDVEIVSVGTSRSSSGSGTNAVQGGGESYDVDMTAVKKGDLQNNCPDDTITVRLHGMDPASPVAGQIAAGGSQLVFGDPSIRTINIGNGMMTIESARHAKIFGIFNLGYTEVSTITPAGPTKIDRPFWVGLTGEQPQVSVAGSDPCAGQEAMGRQGSGLTPGITPTPTPEYQVNEVNVSSCPMSYEECLAQQQYSDYAGQVQAELTCWHQAYDNLSYDCCIQRCILDASSRAKNAADQTSSDFEKRDCIQKCEWNLALSILKETKEQQTSIIRNIG